jgi:hypothetical protein
MVQLQCRFGIRHHNRNFLSRDFHRSRTMGLRWPENHKNIENFIGRYGKLSRAVRSRGFKGKNIAVHLGSLAYKTAFTEFKSVGGLGGPLTDRLPYFFFSYAWVATPPFLRKLQASGRPRTSVSYRQIGHFRKQQTRVHGSRRAAYSARGRKLSTCS